jgi:hypothetical protein
MPIKHNINMVISISKLMNEIDAILTNRIERKLQQGAEN